MEDLAEGFRLQEGQDQGLGDYFTACLRADIESLRLYAGIHRVVYQDYHRLLGRQIGAAHSVFGKKPISSAIIVPAGAIPITGGGHPPHADTRLFVMAVGGVIGLLGLLVWFVGRGERQRVFARPTIACREPEVADGARP